eukprot:784184_1
MIHWPSEAAMFKPQRMAAIGRPQMPLPIAFSISIKSTKPQMFALPPPLSQAPMPFPSGFVDGLPKIRLDLPQLESGYNATHESLVGTRRVHPYSVSPICGGASVLCLEKKAKKVNCKKESVEVDDDDDVIFVKECRAVAKKEDKVHCKNESVDIGDDDVKMESTKKEKVYTFTESSFKLMVQTFLKEASKQNE